MKFEYGRSHRDPWYWHLKARNGERIAHGEGYTTQAACLAAIELVKTASTATEADLSANQPE